MKKIEAVGEHEFAEIVFRGETVPALIEWAASLGWRIVAWPSGNEEATADPKYHSFIVVPEEVPKAATEGLTEEQAAGYAQAWDEAVGEMAAKMEPPSWRGPSSSQRIPIDS